MRKLFLISISAAIFISCGSDNFAPEAKAVKSNNGINYPLSTNDDDNPEVFPLNIEFVTLSQSELDGYEESPLFIPNRVIQDLDTWQALLSQIEGLSILVGNNEIDFETEQVIYSVYFDKNYVTNISSVTEYEDNIVVKVDYLNAQSSSITPDIVFSCHLIKMQKTTKELIFEVEYESEPPYEY